MSLNKDLQLLTHRYDYSGQTSFHNYIERLDLACADASTVGLLGSMFFIGWALASLIIPRIADIYGRKNTFTASLIVQAPAIITIMLSHNIQLTMIALFIMGACASGRVSVGFQYVFELVP